MTTVMTTEQLMCLLRAKHTGQQWAFFEEVPDATGSAKGRTADALAMGLWPSTGVHLHGFEVKVSRADWRKEMQDHSKAYAIKRYCHYWWLVAPRDVAKLEEIPADWGWYVPTDAGKLRVAKACTYLDPTLTYDFLASLCRCIHRECKPTDQNAIDALKRVAYQNGYKDGHTAGRKSSKTDAELNTKLLERVRQTIQQFESASGVKVNDYHAGNIGQAVNLVLYHGVNKIQQVVARMAADSKQQADKWAETQRAIDALMRGESNGSLDNSGADV